MKVTRLYQEGHCLYGDDCVISLAIGDDRIAGTAGWLDTYVVMRNGQLSARVPAWMVIAEFEQVKE